MFEFKCRSCDAEIEVFFTMDNPGISARLIPIVYQDLRCVCGVNYTASELTARAEKYLADLKAEKRNAQKEDYLKQLERRFANG